MSNFYTNYMLILFQIYQAKKSIKMYYENEFRFLHFSYGYQKIQSYTCGLHFLLHFSWCKDGARCYLFRYFGTLYFTLLKLLKKNLKNLPKPEKPLKEKGSLHLCRKKVGSPTKIFPSIWDRVKKDSHLQEPDKDMNKWNRLEVTQQGMVGLVVHWSTVTYVKASQLPILKHQVLHKQCLQVEFGPEDSCMLFLGPLNT